MIRFCVRRGERLPPSFACGVARRRDERVGRGEGGLAQAAAISWLTLNPEASVIRFLGVAENGGAMHPTIFRRPGLRKHG